MSDFPGPIQLSEKTLDELDTAIADAVKEADSKKGHMGAERVAMIDNNGAFGDTHATASINPFEHVQIQIWQTLAYAASNCVLMSQHLGNKDLEQAAYDMLDSANECLKRALEIVEERKRGPAPSFATPETPQ
jgi:acetylornithine/succinyldiaminopimelate/putrescine aminotransferase